MRKILVSFWLALSLGSVHAQAISPVPGGLAAGSTPVTGCTSLQLFYNNAGTLGCMAGTSWDNTNHSLTITGAGSGTDAAFSIVNGADTQFTILDNGRVGFGIVTPGVTLDIRGPYTEPGVNGFVFGSGGSVARIVSTNAAGAGIGAVFAFGGETGLGVTPYGFAYIQGAQQTAGEYGGELSFWTTSSGGGGETVSANYKRMSIDKSGNINIGTASPSGSYFGMAEMTAPAAPAANGARLYCDDNGAGKTRCSIIFASGAAQQIAIEP